MYDYACINHLYEQQAYLDIYIHKNTYYKVQIHEEI